MCFFLCSGEPVGDDPRRDRENRFAVDMMQAPRADPLCCLGSCFCPCCAQIYIRRKALHYDMRNYVCCQGYMDGFVPCLYAGQCGEASCPNLCLCVEERVARSRPALHMRKGHLTDRHCDCTCMQAFACNGCAVSATRMLVMDRHNLRSDEWDNRIIRFNNCIQVASIVCNCIGVCIPEARDLADLVRCMANCTYAATQGCMTAQVNVELEKREDFSAQPPEDDTMERF
ncbi:hypothetical protein PybrP1_009550 [[Pythium] brassicae (nom. inval.)]|nr:hypothetical protein PybrP1_009550 [[Pythium] brassicae (nom. inval.)]